MGKIMLLFMVLFMVALVLPELRALLFVGGFCVVSGYMLGMQHKTSHDAELYANRAERVSMRTMDLA